MKRFLCLFSFLLFFMFVSASPVDFIVVTPGWENVFGNNILFTNKNGYEIFVDENFQYDASDFSLEKEGTVISNGATFDVVVHPTLGRKGRLKFLVSSYPAYKDTVDIVYNSNVVTSFESPDTTIKDATLDCGDGLIDGLQNKIIHFTNDEWEETLSDYSCDFPYRDKLGWHKGDTKVENYSEVEDGDTLIQKYNAQPVTDNITYVMAVKGASRGKIFEFTNDDIYEKIYQEGEDVSYTPFITFTDEDITSESEDETVYTKTVTRTSQVELDTPEAITKDGQKGRTYKILGSYYSTTLKKVLDENTGLYSFVINEEKTGNVTVNENNIKFEVAWPNYSPHYSPSVSYANMKVFDQFSYFNVAYQYSNYPGFKLNKFYYDKNKTQLAAVRNDNYGGLIRTNTSGFTHNIYCESVEQPAILLYAHYDPVPSPSIQVNYNSDDSTFTITSDDDTYLSKIKDVTLGSCSLGCTKFYTDGSLDFSKVQTYFWNFNSTWQLSKLTSSIYKLEDETFYPLDALNVLKISAEGYDDFIQEFNLADKTPTIEVTSDEENFYIRSEPADWIEKHWLENFTTSSGKTGHRFEEVVSPGMRTINLKTLVSENNLLKLNNESINTISFKIHGKIKQYPVSIKLPYIEKVNDLNFKIENKEGRVYFYISSSDTEYINKLVNDKNSTVEYTGSAPTEYFKNNPFIDTSIHFITVKAINPTMENSNTAKYDITNIDKFFSFGIHNEVTIKVDGYADENRHLIDSPITLNETPLDLKVEWKNNGDLEVSFTDDKYANKDKNIAIRFFDGYIDASGNAISEPIQLSSPYTGVKMLLVDNFVDGWDDGYSISKNGAKTVITIPGSEFSKFKDGKQYVVQIGSAGYNAYYSKATYTSPAWKISFDLKDGKWEGDSGEKTVGVQNFGKIGKLPTPVRDGHVFAGWFLNEDTEVKEGDTYSFGKNITVYAKWKATYNLTYKFISSSGKQLMDDYTLTPVVGETINASPATISGYKNLPTKQENVLPNGDKTVTYVYAPEEYSITYNLDGGKLSGQKTSYNIESADYLLPTPTKEGNSFEGWYMTGLSVPIKMIGIGSTGNIDLTAKWKTINTPIVAPPKDDPKPETETKYVYISYVLNGALSNPNPDKAAQGEVINLQPLKRAGYNFQGWTDAQNNLVSTLKADKDVILIANWEPIEYTYTLVSDKGETLKTEKYTIEDEITFAKPSNILDEEYIGWYESGNPDRLITGIKKGTTGNKTYYLKIAKACVIKFVSEHGSTPEDLLIKKGEGNISLPLLAEEGYEFNGWYSDNGLSNAVDSIDSENCEDTTLYAGWTEIPVSEDKPSETPPTDPSTKRESIWETVKDMLFKIAVVGAAIGALAGVGALAYNFIKANLFAIKKAFKKPKLPTKVIVMELKEVDKYKKLITLMNSKKFLKVYLADKDNIFNEIQERNPDLVLMDVFDDETITNYGLLKSNEIFTNSEAKLDIITENGDSFEEDTFSPDSTPGELMSQMVTPLYKDALKEDDSLEYIANVVEALGVPGVPQVIKLYVKGKDIKANFDGDEFSLFEATNVVGDIADILGFEEVEEATDFIKTTKAVADTVRKEKGANAIKDALNMME